MTVVARVPQAEPALVCHLSTFETFEFDLAPNQGPLILHMRGTAAFKHFPREEFSSNLGMDITAVAASGAGSH